MARKKKFTFSQTTFALLITVVFCTEVLTFILGYQVGLLRSEKEVQQNRPSDRSSGNENQDAPALNTQSNTKKNGEGAVSDNYSFFSTVKRATPVVAPSSWQSGKAHKETHAVKEKSKPAAHKTSPSENSKTGKGNSSQSGKTGQRDMYTVQVASLTDKNKALKLVETLKKHGFPAYISALKKDKGKIMYYRVRVGKFEDRAIASRMARKISKKERLDTWITRVY